MEGFSFTIVLFWFSVFSILIISTAIDTTTATQSIRDGETIASAGGSFEMGFFSPGNSKNQYVGIWYKISTTTVVWVANREIPLLDSSRVMKVTEQGILTILNGNGSIIWSSNSTRSAQNPVAVLLNSGNLVVRDGNDNNPDNFLWQSFDYPCVTFLPGMKLGRDLKTGIDRYISSWKSNDDPSRGGFTFRLDPRGFPQLVLMKKSVELFWSGPWNGLGFSGTPNLEPNQFYKFNLVFNDHEIYYIYEPLTSTFVTRMVLNPTGEVQWFFWKDRTHEWDVYKSVRTDSCDIFGFCGPNGRCNTGNSPECGCLIGFVPKFQKEWDVADWSNGCVRRTDLDCQKANGFLKYSGIKPPDTRNSSFDRSMTLEECRVVCSKKCSCMAYSNLYISEGGSGCLLWFGDLIDTIEYQDGQDIYIRMASSEIGNVGSGRKKQVSYIAASVILTVVLLLGLSLTLYLLKKNKLKRQAKLELGPERNTITATQSIRDGETIVSAGGSFELGFFSPGNSKNRYVGIWYKISTTTVVWVANRESPLLESSGVLKVTNQGILTILNGNGSIIWSSNSTRAAQNPVAVLLNSGNLVVRDGNDNNRENFLWQSFDYPCDTLLPGMKLGRDLETGIDRYISSWKSNNDPSRGDFTFRLDPRGFPQLVLMKETVEQFRSGPWNGLRFSGLPNLKPNQFYKFNLIFSDHEIYYIYEPLTSTVVTRLVLNQTGKVQRFIWIHQTNGWSLYLTLLPLDDCDDYAFCGAHGSCNIGNSPECGCLKGFEPKFQKRWDAAYWSNGCVRRTSLDCQKGDGFLKYSGIKLPDVRNSSFDRSMNLEECRMVCLKNCSCMAYSNLDISEGGRGCLLWFGDLIDIRESNQNGQDIYIRMASSEIALQLGKVGSDRKKQKRYIAASVILTVMLLLGLGLTLYLLKKNKLKRQAKLEHGPERSDSTECKKEDLELPLFDYATIADATDNFSVSNKLGEGGFGPVYKVIIVTNCYADYWRIANVTQST
ncbi:hypothetical protein F0562_010219 [Nyssa sinensis]|uniref:non-specific serine/threonine protein kinase n=1 Tax=Nyssa sinensis TaxID=561372 RepID=A0A5J5A146_9ASTE|nr:hypothetical protein F0562_010219 [Nyssa sinensis]